MKWSLLAVVAVLGLLGVAAYLGTLIPRAHRVTRTSAIERPRADVWATLTDYPGFTTWMPGVTRVTPAPPGPDGERWELATGEGLLTLEIVDLQPTERLVTRIKDDGLPFGGTWTFDLLDGPTGTVVSLTEDGWIENPLFRFFAHRVFGIHKTVERTLRGLTRATEKTEN